MTVQSGDTVTFTFKNKKRQTVKTFTFTNIKNNLVVLSFDTETTALFPKGEYRADVCYQGEQRVTLADSCPVLVE